MVGKGNEEDDMVSDSVITFNVLLLLPGGGLEGPGGSKLRPTEPIAAWKICALTGESSGSSYSLPG